MKLALKILVSSVRVVERVVVFGFLAVILLLWSVGPLVVHAVTRTPGFWIRWSLIEAALLGLMLLFGWIFGRQIVRHPLGSDYSPDGCFRADYAYSLREPYASPRLHLSVTDVRTGKVVLRDEDLGDAAELSEARERFADRLPWGPTKQTK